MTHHTPKKRILAVGAAQAIAVSLLATTTAHAVNATWNGLSSNTWQNEGNWSTVSIPGATSGYANLDSVTFGIGGSGTIALGGTVNIQNITFTGDGSTAAAYTIGGTGDVLNVTSSGTISVTGGVVSNQTIGVAGGTLSLSNSTSAVTTLLNNGSGTLTVASDVKNNGSTLVLGGVGNGTISGSISTSYLNISKYGSGTWTLSGARTGAGNFGIYGGTLVLDYASGSPATTSNTATISNSTLVFKGKSSGITTATIGEIDLASSQYLVSNTLKLDANGGSGISLTINTLGCLIGSPAANILIDTSSSASNVINVGALSTTAASVGVANGVLMVGSSGNRRANIITHDATGYGFATLSGATSGTIGRLTSAAGTNLTAAASSNTTNYFYSTSGTLTRTAALDYSTITLDSSAGAITLDMGSYNLAATGQGRAVLVTGNNDVTIAGSGNLGTSTSAYFYNYGTGTLSLSLNSNNGTVALVLGGTGLISYSGTLGGLTTGFEVATLVRLAKAQNMSTNTSKFTVVNGGVLEIGANLSGSSASGDFINAVGVSTNGKITFRGDSGVSAYGGYRVVNFGGAAAQLTWGASGFLTNADDVTDGNYSFLLSSNKSDSTVEVQNAIALGTNMARVVNVANGSAAIDAVLSGTLSGSGAFLKKTGAGTLALTGTSTYDGGTTVSEGVLAVNGSLASGVSVASGATLSGSGTVGGSVASTSGTINGTNLTVNGSANFTGNSTLSGANTIKGGATASGTLTISGTTTTNLSVNVGALAINNGTVKGNVGVSGLLKGSGTVDGDLSLTGGTLAPGNSPGITTVTGNFTMDGNSKLVAEVTGPTAGVGGYDQVKVSGNVYLAGTLDLSTLSGLSLGDSIVLIDNLGTGTTTGYFSSIITSGTTLNIGTSETTYTFTVDGTKYLLNYADKAESDGTYNDVTLTVVPEPGTWAMLVGGLGLLAFGQRMRRSGLKY